MSNLEFAVGKRVVCIDDDWPHGYPFHWPLINTIYTIREIEIILDTACLRFEELVNPLNCHREGRFCEAAFIAPHFRPVRETSIDCFTKLLEKQPELVGGNA